MIISIIVAMDENRVIGKNNQLPWDLPEDIKHFRELTMYKPVIMGRKTFESIGKPLSNRTNILLTRDTHYKARGCVVVHSVDAAQSAAGNAQEVMIIGGEKIYRLFLPRAHRMYLTYIYDSFDGDAYFPAFNKTDWKEIERKGHGPSAKGLFYDFVTLERVWK